MKNICPSCDSSSELVVVSRSEEFEVKGEKVNVAISLFHCNKCGNEFTNKTLPDPYTAAYSEYRRLKGMVQPKEIVEFRKKYNLSQKELSDILGFGGATLSRYENGSLQDQVHDNVLRLAMEPQNILQLLTNNKSLFTPDKFEKINLTIKRELTILEQFDNIINRQQIDEYSGYQITTISKIAEVIKTLCYNREIFKTKLLKLLFYTDFIHFKEMDKSITGLTYVHLPLGPVPDNYDLILGAITTIDRSIYLEPVDFGNYSGEIVRIKEPPKTSVLSSSEVKVLNFVSGKFVYFSSKDMSEISHKEDAYIKTGACELISYNFAKTMNLD